MLKEIKATRQIAGEPLRRWFSGEHMDLILWHQAGEYIGFQLSYDKSAGEKAVSWKQSTGLIHERVDSGEDRVGHYKASPILLQNTEQDLPAIRDAFLKYSASIDDDVRDFVLSHLQSAC